jgi:hypothetical protein
MIGRVGRAPFSNCVGNWLVSREYRKGLNLANPAMKPKLLK